VIPSVVATQLQDTLVDYILATLAFDDDTFATAFEAQLRGPDGLFRGPYLRLGLPFQVAGPADHNPLTIRPDFLPYAHQLQSFRQLHSGGATPASNTLVTTGTGSGKTECFLYPILDHCFRHQGAPGVKAVLIYPMNALATDQARRLAGLIHEDERLRGKVRAGLYVGGGNQGLPSQMGPDHLVENKQALRNEPPDILLTNYKMFDFMLLRPDERRLWQHNAPETLRYLVIDELHTFDGAQGSDVGCLVRRIKNRLRTPEGHLVCAGTSATIGSTTEANTFAQLAAFAREVFDEPFDAAHVVRERRVARADFLLPPRTGPTLPAANEQTLDSDSFADPLEWLDAQQTFWLGEVHEPLALGKALRAHPLLNHLLAVAATRPASFEHVDEALANRVEEWGGLPSSARRLLLSSFLALVSHARRDVGGSPQPLLTVQIQLWTRELTRLLRSLPDQQDDTLLPPRFAWWTDVPGQAQPEGLYAPQAHCRECGIDGIAAMRTESDRHKGKITLAPGAVGQAWLQNHRDACFVWPRPLDREDRPTELVHWLHPDSATLHGEMPTEGDGTPRGGPVLLETTTKEYSGNKRFAARCPACGSDDALSIVGARAASLSSVAVSQLFQSPLNDDKKLLAFTDSVQDACHRAGFFGGRTFRIHLRTAMQAVIAARDPLLLHEAAQAFEDHWRSKLGDLAYLAAFLPPDLRELPEYLRYVDTCGKGKHERIWRILRERLGWEFTREFGVAAAIGRSLEQSAASTVVVDLERFERASTRFAAWYREQGEARPEADPAHFLRGLLHRMRHMGAVHHPYLERYAKADGNRYLLNKRKNPHMSPVGPHTKRIRFVSSRPRGDVFHSPFGRNAGRGWFGDWVRRCLHWPEPGPDALARVYGQALNTLTDAGVLSSLRGASGVDVWGLAPEALALTRSVGAVQSGHRGRVFHVAHIDAEAADGKTSWAFRATARLEQVEPVTGYYAAVYGRGATSRIFPGEHTGLLTRESRTELESRFLRGSTPEDPQAPNLLVATPTLEMGVDIGDLSAAMLCSVPPTPANYLQRIGRAGRKTGNAMIFVLATAQPHDLYFHADPLLMLDGDIQPPGVFLGAVAMLRRQLSAWCMDHWARDDDQAGPIPRKASLVLGTSGRQQFPGRLVDYVTDQRDKLLEGFLDRFGGTLSTEGRAALTAWIEADDAGFRAAFDEAFEDLKAQIDGYRAERDKAWKRIKKIEQDPTAIGDPEQEIRELRSYRATLGHLIDELRNKYPLNVLADASLLPNYAFPESGVKLHSRLGADTEEEGKGGKKKRTYEKREYVRPAARALRELAPFNTFYAEGHKVVVRELDLGPKAARVQHWRFCPTCHHRHKAVDPTKPAAEGACPRCGEPHWADKGQVRSMLPLNTVRSVADRVRSTTADDTEERSRESFHIHQVFDVRPENLDGEAVVLPELGFGFEYLREVTLTEVNLGLTVLLEGSPKVKIAGESASALGFPTCRDCGTVRDPRAATRRRPPPEHSPFCSQKGSDTKPREELYLFREVQSEAVRFLLPFSEVQVEPKLRSFQAAVAFGLRRTFGGRPIHLQIATMTEPAGANRDGQKHFLVLFDSVPGGTGYLREYRHRRAVFGLLEDALEGLRSCSCRTLGRDGCYLCLFARQSQRHLPILSSRLAEELLDRVVRARHTAEQAPGGLSLIDVAPVLESELEEKFIAALQVQYGDRFVEVDGGVAWELRAEDSLWRLETQQWLTDEAGEPMRTDFVFTGVQGPAVNERVAVECDGFDAHVQPGKPEGRVSSDFRKRARVAAQPGWRLFQLTWHDLSESTAVGLAPAALVGVPDAVWAKVFPSAAKTIPADAQEAVMRLPHITPFELLCSYLERPGDHWTRGVAAMLCARLAAAAQQGTLVDGHGLFRLEDHLRSSPELAPLPPYGTCTTAPRAADFWGITEARGDLALLVRAKGTSIRSFSTDGIEVLLRLDDRAPRRADEAFSAAWRSALHSLNLTWLLPNTEVLTDEEMGLDAGEAGSEVLADFGLLVAAEPPGPTYGSGEQLREVLESCFDDDARMLVRAVHEAGLPLPAADRPELAKVLIPDLAWPELRLAVVHPDQAEPRDIGAARAEGWTLLLMPIEAADLLTAVRNATRPT
jgi:DEAD/DEAH box helicase domain-containing protein